MLLFYQGGSYKYRYRNSRSECKAFDDYTNVFDGSVEAYMRNGQKEFAIKNY